MKWYQFVGLTALAVQLGGTGTAADRAASGGEVGGMGKLPPVLRPTDPPDSGQVTLPGAPLAPPALKKIVPLAPVAKLSPLPAILLEDASLRKPIPLPVSIPAAKPVAGLPVGLEAAPSCQKQIGHWKESDARKALGEPTRHRPAFDEKKSVNGTIYAFTDPNRKHKELELDFDSKSGLLRTVFVYPARLTWQECRRQWSGPVAAADAAQGRKFYSYTNRRLDVLVDSAGKVISLGWY